MYRYEKILVYLNAQDEEQSVLEMAGKITHLAKSKKMIFSHFCDVKEIPGEVKEKYPWLMTPLDQAVKEKIADSISKHFKPYSETQVETKVREGHAIYKLLEEAQNEDIDLIIVGKNALNGDLPIRLARKAPCSVIAVPEGADANFENILVTVDFSKYSEYSIDVATAFAKAQNLPSVAALHVSLLPQGRGKILPETEYKELNDGFFNDKLKTFLEPLDKHDIEVQPHISHAYSVNNATGDFIQEHQTDLIITGCRGKDALSALLLGSNAESIIGTSKIPVIAVKEKGTGKSFLENLLGMMTN